MNLYSLAGLNINWEDGFYDSKYLSYLMAELNYDIEEDKWCLNGGCMGIGLSRRREEKVIAINKETMDEIIKYILSKKEYRFLNSKCNKFKYTKWFDSNSHYIQGKYEGSNNEVEIYYDSISHFFILGILNKDKIEEIYPITNHSASCIVSFENKNEIFEPVFIGDSFNHEELKQDVAYGPPIPSQIIFEPPYMDSRLKSAERYLRAKSYKNPKFEMKLKKEDINKAQKWFDNGRKFFPLWM